MKILTIGTDRELFIPESMVGKRYVEYGSVLKEIHAIVFSLKKHGLKKGKLAPNVWIYPTNSSSRFLYWCDAWRMGRKLDEFDVISSQDPFECGLAARLIAGSLKSKLQIQIHTDFLNPAFRRQSLLNYFRYTLGKRLIKKADCLRAVSKRIETSLLNLLPSLKDKISVLPIFIDAERIKSMPVEIDLKAKYSDYNFMILMASRLTKEKNIDMALEAFKEILNLKPGKIKPLLLIVGDGPEKENLKRKVKVSDLEDNVVFEEPVQFVRLISYYKTCDLFLLTSSYEGYGRTLVEAAISGCKIISSNVGISEEILEEINIFAVGDKYGLKTKIFLALENKIKSAKIPKLKAKEEYLEKYKKSLESCCK